MQHSKSEHWAPCHIQTLSRYDRKIVESDVKPKSDKHKNQSWTVKLLEIWSYIFWRKKKKEKKNNTQFCHFSYSIIELKLVIVANFLYLQTFEVRSPAEEVLKKSKLKLDSTGMNLPHVFCHSFSLCTKGCLTYCIYHKCWDWQVWANSVDPDQMLYSGNSRYVAFGDSL